MLIEELERRTGGKPLTPFDSRAHAELYKAQPRERRRVINALVRAGGEMEYAKLLSETTAPPEAFRALYDQGLVTPIPSREAPDRVVLPLERLFATPLAENDPDKLVEALKVYPREVLWMIASARRIPVDGAEDCVVRARLFHHALSGAGVEGLNADDVAPLTLLASEGWVLEADRFFDRLDLIPPAGGRSAETLFASLKFGKSFLLDLLLRMLIIPVRSSPGTSYYRQLGIPRELRSAVAKGLMSVPPRAPVPKSSKPRKGSPPPAPSGPHPDCVLERSLEWDSREGRFSGDLTRFILLFDQNPPSLTQKGTLNRRDLSRLSKSSGMDEDTFEALSSLVRGLPVIQSRGTKTRIADGAGELVSLDAGTLARRVFLHFPVISITGTRVWFSDGQCRYMRDLVLHEFSILGRESRERHCLHCLAWKTSLVPEFRKLLVYSSAEPYAVAKTLWEASARLFHVAGFTAVARKEDRIVAMRMTPTGQQGIGRGLLPVAAKGGKNEAIVVQPTGEIIVPRSIPFEELRCISRACDVKSVDAVAIFSMTRQSLLRAAQHGVDPLDVKAILETRSTAALPRTVSILFQELEARAGEIEILPCSAVVRVKDPALLKLLGEGLTSLEGGLAMASPDVDPAALLARLRKQGYLPRLAGSKGAAKKQGSTDTINEVLEDALQSGDLVSLSFRDGGEDTVSIDEVGGGEIKGLSIDSGKEVTYLIRSLVAAEPVPSF